MTEKQISTKGITAAGWKRIDNILEIANKEQLRKIIIKCSTRLPDEISITFK